MMIVENDDYSLEQSAECAIPGYLVLRLQGPARPATSLAELKPEAAMSLGEMLARAARAIEQATGAERVYILSFCEADRRLHFHLFPRTAWLLKEYFMANDCAGDPVNGPMLFEWARHAFKPGSRLPEGTPDIKAICAALRELLK